MKQFNMGSFVNGDPGNSSGKIHLFGVPVKYTAPEIKLGSESTRRYAESGQTDGGKIRQEKPDPKLRDLLK